MEVSEAIRYVLEKQGRNQTWLGEEMGVSASAVNNMLARGNLRYESLVRVCEILGYELVMRTGAEEIRLEGRK